MVKELACQWRGSGLEPWSRKIPHTDRATKLLSLCAATTEDLEPGSALGRKRSRCNEEPEHRNEEQPPLSAAGEHPCAATKTQCSQK